MSREQLALWMIQQAELDTAKAAHPSSPALAPAAALQQASQSDGAAAAPRRQPAELPRAPRPAAAANKLGAAFHGGTCSIHPLRSDAEALAKQLQQSEQVSSAGLQKAGCRCAAFVLISAA